MNLSDFLGRARERFPHKMAVVCGSNRLTYRRLAARADALSAALLNQGTVKGERIAVLSLNSTCYVEIIFALMKIGAVGVPLNWRLTKEEIRRSLDHSGATVLFYGKEMEAKVPSDAGGIRRMVCIGDGAGAPRA